MDSCSPSHQHNLANLFWVYIGLNLKISIAFENMSYKQRHITFTKYIFFYAFAIARVTAELRQPF